MGLCLASIINNHRLLQCMTWHDGVANCDQSPHRRAQARLSPLSGTKPWPCKWHSSHCRRNIINHQHDLSILLQLHSSDARVVSSPWCSSLLSSTVTIPQGMMLPGSIHQKVTALRTLFEDTLNKAPLPPGIRKTCAAPTWERPYHQHQAADSRAQSHMGTPANGIRKSGTRPCGRPCHKHQKIQSARPVGRPCHGSPCHQPQEDWCTGCGRPCHRQQEAEGKGRWTSLPQASGRLVHRLWAPLPFASRRQAHGPVCETAPLPLASGSTRARPPGVPEDHDRDLHSPRPP